MTAATQTKPTARERRQRRRASLRMSGGRRIGWLMAAPAIFLILLFIVIPFLSAFVLSFTNQRLISPNPTEWVGLRNFDRLLSVEWITLDAVVDENGNVMVDEDGNIVYEALREYTRNNPDYPQFDRMQEWKSFERDGSKLVLLAGDVVFIRALVNTFIFALVIVPVQGGLGLMLALLVNRKIRGVNIFRTIYFIPVVMSMVVLAILWEFLYDGENGLINSALGAMTFGVFQPIDWLGSPSSALPAIMILSVWQGVGFHMIIWLSGLQTIPGVLYEAAAIDGASRWQTFRNVTWPGLRNTAIFVLITITIAAFGLFTQVDVMTQGGPLDSTTTVVHQAVENGFRQQDIAYGSAISLVLFVLVTAVALIQAWLTRERT